MANTAKDNLKDHLAPYRDEDIQKIREEKMQLVTAAEFKALHKQMLEEKLELENEVSRLSQHSETKLTIPKKIADKLDSIWDEYISNHHNNVWNFLVYATEMYSEIYFAISDLIKEEIKENIVVAYFTGKALGIEFVEVVE